MIHEISKLIIEKEEKLKDLITKDKPEYYSDFKRITEEYKIQIQEVINKVTKCKISE